MKKQTLSIEQMEHLKELGVDVSKASMKLISVYPSSNYDEEDEYEFIPVDNRFCAKLYNEHGNTFTLQDILNILPRTLLMMDKRSGQSHQCLLSIDLRYNSISYGYDIYGNDHTIIIFKDTNLINAAYEMLYWCIENRYLSKIYYND